MLSSERTLVADGVAAALRRKVYPLLDTWVNALTQPELNQLLQDIISAKRRCIVANHNLHSLYVYHHDSKMREFYRQADYIHVDGMAMVAIGQLFGLPLERKHRVTYADWIYSIMSTAARERWRVFYLGSKPGVAEQGAQIFRQQYPTLQLKTAHGYFNAQPESDDSQNLLNAINQYRPHLLMVGMSMPRQEHWILDNISQLKANVVLPSGAAIDYVAGNVPTPPRWAGRWGLEWLFRLIAEPRRLGQRYLIEPWFVLKILLARYAKRVLL